MISSIPMRAKARLTWKIGWQHESMLTLIIHYLIFLLFVITLNSYSINVLSMAETCQSPRSTAKTV